MISKNNVKLCVVVCLLLFSSKECIIKRLLDLVFVISRTESTEGLGKCYQPWPLAWLVTLTSTLINLEITKTSSYNCLLKEDIKRKKVKSMLLTTDLPVLCLS